MRAISAIALGSVLSTACDRTPQASSATQSAESAPGHKTTEAQPPGRSPGDSPRAPSPKATNEEAKDRGIFSDLDDRIDLECPQWLRDGPLLAVQAQKSSATWWAFDGVIVCRAEKPLEEIKTASLSSPLGQDHDGDGIPDAVDILRGAKKAVANAASYKSSYRKLTFPGGDVPRTEGVCTDVIVRSLRNAGRDLQELLARDIEKRPRAYPMVQKADRNIDHRRVRTLLPYFKEHFEELTPAHKDSAFPYLPADIVFMNTLGDSQPEHLGIVSDRLGASGSPLIINNWTEGTATREMDLLGRFEVTHRFRVVGKLMVEEAHRGLSGVLHRHGLKLPEVASQVLLVTTPSWGSSGGTLTRWQKNESGSFTQIGDEQPARIGASGLGSGRGLHGDRRVAPQTKKEGDKRAPSGLFGLGTAFGRRKRAPYDGTWPYRALSARDYWVDDPKSPDYNKWITLKSGESLSASAEHLMMYSLGLVVEHNTKRPEPGAGSAIFVHPWKSPETPTVGCTALPEDELQALLAWLDPEKSPVLVQVAGHSY